jgi:hypothetical protein
MLAPAQRLFEADLLSAGFRGGVAKGLWGPAESDAVPVDAVWPKAYFWLAAAPRHNAPVRFYIAIDVDGYRAVPPTGTFWDPTKKTPLEAAMRPKGRPNSRFARVFRDDWEKGMAFYHPYDRVTVSTHPNWLQELPHLIWTAQLTIVDYLAEFQSLLNNGDYIGV